MRPNALALLDSRAQCAESIAHGEKLRTAPHVIFAFLGSASARRQQRARGLLAQLTASHIFVRVRAA
jgi:hypothetical protein